MEYSLRNGKTVMIRKPVVDDAEEIISLISTADKETLFLARSPGEFNATIEKERDMIAGTLPNALRYLDGTHVAEYSMIKFINEIH